MEAELFHANGRTDLTKSIAPFRNFANAPKKVRNKPKLLLVNKKHNEELQNGNESRTQQLSDLLQRDSPTRTLGASLLKFLDQTQTHTYPAGLL